MGELKISFQFYSLFVHHAEGLTVLLPVDKHTASISGALVGEQSLHGVKVDLIVEDAVGSRVTARASPGTHGRLADVRLLDPSAAATIDNVRTHLSGALQSGIAARVNLTAGGVSDHAGFAKEFAGAVWKVNGNPGHELTDTGHYSLPLDPAKKYTLRFSGDINQDYSLDPTQPHELFVSNGDTHIGPDECPDADYADPFYLEEFSKLFAAVGVTVGAPSTPMPAPLVEKHKIHVMKEAGGGHETICKPCPNGCIVLN